MCRQDQQSELSTLILNREPNQSIDAKSEPVSLLFCSEPLCDAPLPMKLFQDPHSRGRPCFRSAKNAETKEWLPGNNRESNIDLRSSVEPLWVDAKIWAKMWPVNGSPETSFGLFFPVGVWQLGSPGVFSLRGSGWEVSLCWYRIIPQASRFQLSKKAPSSAWHTHTPLSPPKKRRCSTAWPFGV